MQVTETLSAGLKREYKVVVNQAELDQELNAKLADLSKRANIKGFRPGKVPVHHLKRIYGKSAMAEVVQNTIDSKSKALLEEKKLKPAYQPEVKLPEDQAEVAAVMDGDRVVMQRVGKEGGVVHRFDLFGEVEGGEAVARIGKAAQAARGNGGPCDHAFAVWAQVPGQLVGAGDARRRRRGA